MNIPRMNYRQYRKARRLTHECCNYCDGTASCWTMGRNVSVFRAFPIRCCAGGSRRLSFHWTLPSCRADGAEPSAALPGVRRAVFTQASKLPLLSGLCRKTQASEQEAVGEEAQGLCVEKVKGKNPDFAGLFPLVGWVVVC